MKTIITVSLFAAALFAGTAAADSDHGDARGEVRVQLRRDCQVQGHFAAQLPRILALYRVCAIRNGITAGCGENR